MKRLLHATAAAVLAAACGVAGAGGVAVGFPVNALVLSDQSGCPSGYAENTNYAGRYVAGIAASGNAGDTLGTAIATTTTDSAGSTYSVTGTNFVTTAGSKPTATAIGGTTLASGANTITPPSTKRSSLVPSASFRLCGIISDGLIWEFDATTLSMTPTVGTGTPTVTRSGTAATFVGSNGLIQTASANAARFDYDPVALTLNGLLVEEARTNLILRSEALDNASWTATRSSVSANGIAAPDGNVTADKIVEDTSNNTHYVSQNVTKAASSLTYTFSAYLKSSGRTIGYLDVADGLPLTNGAFSFFNLSTCAAGASNGVFGSGFTFVSASATSGANGFCRVVITATTNTATTVTALTGPATADGTSSYTGDGSSGIYEWGTDLEQATTPTSYIATTSAAVTRNEDQITLLTSAVTGFSASTGTLYAKANVPYAITAQSQGLMTVGNLTLVDYHIIYRYGTTATFGYQELASSVTGMNATFGSFTTAAVHKLAAAYASGSYAACADNGTVQTSAGGALPAVTQITLGGTVGTGISTNYLNGWLLDARLYNVRTANGALCAMTAP